LIAGLRLAAGFLILLLLSACAAPARLHEEPPIVYPAALRDQLVALATSEWEAFGRGVSDYRGAEVIELQAPRWKDDPRVFHHIQAYWNAVRGEREKWPRYIREQRAVYRGSDAPAWRDIPWSAAFISYLMRSAGVDRADFYWSAAHSFYLDHAIRASRRWGTRALYTPLDLSEHRPEPGDLLCQDRSHPPDKRLLSVAERARELGRFRPMHCDIVVARAPYRLSLIGGNLGKAVRLIYLPLDSYGRLRPWPPQTGERSSPFALLRLNIS